jgi:hypothetical protein
MARIPETEEPRNQESPTERGYEIRERGKHMACRWFQRERTVTKSQF